jgi:ABC-type nitrate/sulfonate/bicarbonate transport system substrate-binding protein
MKWAGKVMLVLVLAALIAASGWAGGKAESGELKKVHVGATPFFDYQFWSVAKEWGWDKELGLDLQMTWMTQSGPSIQALANGSLDTINTCVVCNFPFYESVPDMVDFLTVNQFKGFVVIGRKGQSKTYQEFLKELGNADAARKAAISQLKGKTMPMYTANYVPMLKGLLEQVSLDVKDVNVINFPDDEKAAIAMIGGTGDYFMGGLPSEINLIMNHPNDFQLIGGSEILGPAGLWYSNIASTNKWLAANEDTALRIMALSYRYNRYVNEDIDKVMPIVAKAMNEHSGVATDVEELKFIFRTFLEFRTYQKELVDTYNPQSPLYWKNSGDYFVKRSSELPANADVVARNPLEAWQKKFMARKDLLKWVDKPLK